MTSWVTNKNTFNSYVCNINEQLSIVYLWILIWPMTSTKSIINNPKLCPYSPSLLKQQVRRYQTFHIVEPTACFNSTEKAVNFAHLSQIILKIKSHLALHFFHNKSNHNPGWWRGTKNSNGWSENILTIAASACEYEIMHDEYKETKKSIWIHAELNQRKKQQKDKSTSEMLSQDR